MIGLGLADFERAFVEVNAVAGEHSSLDELLRAAGLDAEMVAAYVLGYAINAARNHDLVTHAIDALKRIERDAERPGRMEGGPVVDYGALMLTVGLAAGIQLARSGSVDDDGTAAPR